MDGWLLINKPEGISSAQALNYIKKLFKLLKFKNKKIGHAGTLDPLACGLLVVAVGEATKLINFIMDAPKAYEFSILWGENRDTLDREGNIIETSALIPTPEQINKVIIKFMGKTLQLPPLFSAIKINGKRACDRIRDGEQIELTSREVTLYNFVLLEHSQTSKISKFYAVCGKGFYIRSLARDITNILNTCGHIYSLKRTQSKKFNLEDAISLEQLKNILHNDEQFDCVEFLESNLRPLTCVLDDILVQNVNAEEAKNLRNGKSISSIIKFSNNYVAATYNSKLVAIGMIEKNLFKPKRVFN